MNCPKCGAETFENAIFCTACGETFMQGQPEIKTENTAAMYASAPQSTYSQPYSMPSQMPYVAPPIYMPQKPGNKEKNWQAICSMMCGIASIPMMMTAFGGVFTAIAAIIFSFNGFKSQKVGMSVAGLICGIVGLLLSGFMVYSIIINQMLDLY